MNDDIVTRLRKHHEWFGTGGQPTSVWEDAADEIERLRETVRVLKYSIEHQVCECSHCLDEEGAS